jgi:hypothetical protein
MSVWVSFDPYHTNDMRPHGLIPTAVIVVSCLAWGGCGVKHKVDSRSVSSAAAIVPSPSLTGDYDRDDDIATKGDSDGDNDDNRARDKDNDSDNRSGSYFDADDAGVREYGRPAGAADRKAVARLVERYFALADARDGATACELIAPTFAKAVPETLGRPPGPPYASGATCAVVMSKLFIHFHRQLAAHAASLRVSAVRVAHGEAIAVLAFHGLPGRQIRAIRADGRWRMNSLLDTELP